MENSSVSPTPSTGSFLFTTRSSISPDVVKSASPDIVIFNDKDIEDNAEAIVDLLFENIGGQELLQIARYDTVNGQEVLYQPIKNLSSIQQQYNPNNILSVQSTSDKYFSNFPIKLENKIPRLGTGPNGKHIYIDSTNGNLVIEAVNVEQDEQIEIEITVSGTIYEAEFGEITS